MMRTMNLMLKMNFSLMFAAAAKLRRKDFTGLAVSAKRLLEEIRRRMVRVESPRVGPTPQIEGSEVEGDVAFY